jgi:XTP/dITP diphosphohydrolase
VESPSVGERTGSQVLRLVNIMDQLRSENGCPWDAEQTHQTLSEYLLEETYETLAAIAEGETSDLVEELGDLLLQVVFHARLGQEESPSWDIDDVANGISDKLIRRHPNVFPVPADTLPVSGAIQGAASDPISGAEADPGSTQGSESGSEPGVEVASGGGDANGTRTIDSGHVARNWTQAKAVEKGRTSSLDGIPLAMPALAQAQKTWRRSVESGLAPRLPTAPADPKDHERLGEALLAMAVEAERSGMDAEAALRAAIAKLRLEILELEGKQ